MVDEVQIQSSHLNTQLTYLEANIPLTGNNRIQFQSGDVIGFYNPSDSRYEIRDKTTPGYVFYTFVGSTATSLDLSNADVTRMGRQPLIQFSLGEYVDNYFICCCSSIGCVDIYLGVVFLN